MTFDELKEQIDSDNETLDELSETKVGSYTFWQVVPKATNIGSMTFIDNDGQRHQVSSNPKLSSGEMLSRQLLMSKSNSTDLSEADQTLLDELNKEFEQEFRA